MTADRAPRSESIDRPWIIAPALAELPPIPLRQTSESDAEPRPLSRRLALLILLLLSLGVWGVIWGVAKAIMQ